jgi:hypothetical protein
LGAKLARCRSKQLCQAFCQDLFWQTSGGKSPANRGVLAAKILAKIFGQKSIYTLVYQYLLYLSTREIYI